MDKKIRVLIVDDDEKIGKVFTAALQEEGLEAQYVLNGNDAVSSVQKGTFDLILMDVMMPGMNGFQTLEAIRSFNEAVKVVMITGYSVEKLLDKAKQYNICATLKKPVSIVKIIEVIQQIFK